MDTALPARELAAVKAALDSHLKDGVQYHALRTRQSAARRFVSVHVLVPGTWTVHRGHELLEDVEAKIRAQVPDVTIMTHLESLDDPRSWYDDQLDRRDPPPPSAADRDTAV
jgi:divalent metal cation (Fe/Co/Zn/Cd) transporter